MPWTDRGGRWSWDSRLRLLHLEQIEHLSTVLDVQEKNQPAAISFLYSDKSSSEKVSYIEW